MTQWLSNEQWGSGEDGSKTISSNTTQSPIDASCSGNSGTKTLNATNAAFSADQIILIHQTQGNDSKVGKWELNVIDSYSTGTITTKYNLANTYGDSDPDEAQVLVLPQYSSVTVNGGNTWYSKAWGGNVGGILAFMCNGTTTINGQVIANSRGFRKGSGSCDQNRDGNQAEGTGGTGGTSENSNNGSGGGGCAFENNEETSGGGGGGNGESGGSISTSYGTAYGGDSTGNNTLTSMTFGGGGGGTTRPRSDSDCGENGGDGGGIILIYSKSFDVSSGYLKSEGDNGVNSAHGRVGAGGGGAGGSIYISGSSVDIGSSRVRATKGSGGSNSFGDSDTQGQDGGSGRIRVMYGNSLSGSISSSWYGTYTTAQTNNLTTTTSTSTTTTSTSTTSSSTSTSTSTSTSLTSTSTTTTSTSTTSSSTSTTTTSTSTTSTSTTSTSTTTDYLRFNVEKVT